MQPLTYVVSISLSHNHGKRPFQSCWSTHTISRMHQSRSQTNDRGYWFGNETKCAHAYKIRKWRQPLVMVRCRVRSEEVRHAYGRARNSVSRIVSEYYKIDVATALEVRFCTSRVELTRACRSTILGLRIVEKGLYCSCVSVELRSDNFAARAG